MKVAVRMCVLTPADFPPGVWTTTNRPQRCGCETGDDRKLLLDFAAQLVNLLAHASIDFLEFSLHHPERRIVSAAELLHLSPKSLADAWIGIVLVALPALEHGLAHAIQAGAVPFEIAPERPVQKPF